MSFVHRAAVTRLEVDVRNLADQYVRLHDATSTSLRESTSNADSVHGSYEALENIKQNQTESKDLLLDMLSTMEKMSIDKQLDQRFDEYIEQPSETKGRRGSSPIGNTPLYDGAVSEPINSAPHQSVFSIAMKAKLRNARSCALTCQCQCHSKTNLQTPQLLQRLTGRLLLGYTGIPYFRTKCLPECSREDSKGFTMTYFFPQWFFEKAVSLSVNETFLGTPSLNVKLRRVVPEMSHVFAMSRYGDVEGLKTLFLERKASPDDVHIRGGWNPLHVSHRRSILLRTFSNRYTVRY